MKIVFFGTPAVSVPPLERLASTEYKPILVITRPDAPRGRGLKLSPSPVKEKALELGIPVLTPFSLNDPVFLNQLKDLSPHLFVVIAFPILPKEILSIPLIGSLNIHFSLLPKYRGAAPVERAIMNGEKETGVSLFFLTEKVDQGPIIAQKKVTIGDEENAGELKSRLSLIGSELLLELLPKIERGEINPLEQPPGEVSWAPKIKESECEINWREPAERIKNLIRALTPNPGAFTFRNFKGRRVRIKILKGSVSSKEIPPGKVEVIQGELLVGCGIGSLKVETLQVEGRKPSSARDFLLGNRIEEGETWG